jgi:lysophospholipase L1-like esterase
MALVDAKAADIAVAHGVEQLDLMPLLDRSLATYYDGFHLTPAGAKAVASAVAAAVLRQPVSVRAATALEDELPAA